MDKILFNIETEKLKNLDAIIAEKGWSRAEAIRYAIDNLIEQETANEKLAKKAFGLWKGRKVDGVEFQKKLRSEWE